MPEGVLEALNDAHADVDGDRVTLHFKVARALLDQARKAIRDELDVDTEGEKRDEQPKPGARTKRSIR